MSSTTESPKAQGNRLASLDQFRGYTVMGMLLVNYFSSFQVCPQIWKHSHDYCSYADTIMPQFLFAVGFALRLTIGRKLQQQGQDMSAYLRMVRRLLGLVLISIVIYHVKPRAQSWHDLLEVGFLGAFYEPLKRDWFQTLMHIAATSLWILPVVSRSARARIVWMIASAVIHVVLSYLFNFHWCNTNPNAIDGGPLGFLTWSIPALLGTLACDWFVDGIADGRSVQGTVRKSVLVSLLIMGLGYALSCGTRLYDVPAEYAHTIQGNKLAKDPVSPTSKRWKDKLGEHSTNAWLAEPPFVQPPPAQLPPDVNPTALRQWNYWMMSQRAGTVSYTTFAAGLSLLVFVVFYIVCDRWRWQWSVFRTFGTNALAAYIMHTIVAQAVKPFFPGDSPWWFAYCSLAVFFLINWLLLRGLERQGIYLRV